MHAVLVGLLLGLAIALRYQWQRDPQGMPDWGAALSAFLIPPMLLLLMAVAVIQMGTHGQMFALPVGPLGYGVGMAFLGWALVRLGISAWEGGRSVQTIRHLPPLDLNQTPGHLLPSDHLFAGQVGFWKPELVVSQGLLTTLTPDQLQAVLAHEQAHCHYHDTFWYFWLGWLRQLTGWLPNTNVLWQELLLLRELRADRWAAQRVDPLVLAETLLMVTQSYQPPPQGALADCVALSDAVSRSRLELRIDQLLADPSQPPLPQRQERLKWLWMLLPLTLVLFHS